MPPTDGPVTDEILRGLALLAVAQVDAGTTSGEMVKLLWPLLARYGLDSPMGILRVAAAAAEAPGPPEGANDWVLATLEATTSLRDVAERLES